MIKCNKHHQSLSLSHSAISNVEMSCRLFLFPRHPGEERRSCEGEAIVQNVLVSSRTIEPIPIIFVCE